MKLHVFIRRFFLNLTLDFLNTAMFNPVCCNRADIQRFSFSPGFELTIVSAGIVFA